MAAVLYVTGAASVLFVASRGHDVPDAFVSYWPLYVIGMALVVVAALLWPTPERDEGREGSVGNDDFGEGGEA